MWDHHCLEKNSCWQTEGLPWHLRPWWGSRAACCPRPWRPPPQRRGVPPGPQIALFDMPNLNRFDILSISIFCKIALSISISISIFSKITISISISISIFLELPYRYRYRYRYFSELPYRYRYRYRYFSKVSIYRQSIFPIDILTRRRSKKNVFYRCTWGRSNKMCFTGAKKMLFLALFG